MPLGKEVHQYEPAQGQNQNHIKEKSIHKLYWSGFFGRFGFLSFTNSSRLLEFLVQDPFDLSVDTAKFIGRPFLQRLVSVTINPYYKTLFIAHGTGLIFFMSI